MRYARLIEILAGHHFYMYVHPLHNPEEVMRLRIAGVWRNPRGCFFVRTVNPEHPGIEGMFGQIDPGDEFFIPIEDNPLDNGLCTASRPTPHVINGLDLSALED